MVKLYAGNIDSLKGPQLPEILSELALEEDLPTFKAFVGQAQFGPDAFQPYCEALRVAKHKAWLSYWGGSV